MPFNAGQKVFWLWLPPVLSCRWQLVVARLLFQESLYVYWLLKKTLILEVFHESILSIQIPKASTHFQAVLSFSSSAWVLMQFWVWLLYFRSFAPDQWMISPSSFILMLNNRRVLRSVVPHVGIATNTSVWLLTRPAQWFEVELHRIIALEWTLEALCLMQDPQHL